MNRIMSESEFKSLLKAVPRIKRLRVIGDYASADKIRKSLSDGGLELKYLKNGKIAWSGQVRTLDDKGKPVIEDRSGKL